MNEEQKIEEMAILRVLSEWVANGGTFETRDGTHYAKNKSGQQVIANDTLYELAIELEKWCIGFTARGC